MISITSHPIKTDQLSNTLTNPKAGALVTFEGWVRNHNEGLSVDALEYEAYEDLCIAEGKRILTEAQEMFKVYQITCTHRVGKLAIGELAVWVGACSAHRKAAFDACQYVIDQLKIRLPIWKKEHYTSGKTEWVNCQQCSAHKQNHHLNFTERDLYEKQTKLQEFSNQGQKKLKKTKLLVIGAGGLGSPALQYLAGAGIGTLGVCDGDLIEPTNLQRQTLFSTQDIGSYKVDIAKQRLQQQNPFINIIIHREFLDFENAERIIENYDYVLDCTDQFTTKFLIHDICWHKKIPLIQANAYQLEGQIQCYSQDDQHMNSCMRCLWEEFPEKDSLVNCSDVGVLGSAVGSIGCMQANEAILQILGQSKLGFNKTMIIDMQYYDITKIQRDKNPRCHFCQSNQHSFHIDPNQYKSKKQLWELDQSISELQKAGYEFLDIRDKNDPMELIENHDPTRKLVLGCHRGIRSYKLVKKMRQKGFDFLYSYAPGLKNTAKISIQ